VPELGQKQSPSLRIIAKEKPCASKWCGFVVVRFGFELLNERVWSTETRCCAYRFLSVISRNQDRENAWQVKQLRGARESWQGI